jgi:hypothetical protein
MQAKTREVKRPGRGEKKKMRCIWIKARREYGSAQERGADCGCDAMRCDALGCGANGEAQHGIRPAHLSELAPSL